MVIIEVKLFRKMYRHGSFIFDLAFSFWGAWLILSHSADIKHRYWYPVWIMIWEESKCVQICRRRVYFHLYNHKHLVLMVVGNLIYLSNFCVNIFFVFFHHHIWPMNPDIHMYTHSYVHIKNVWSNTIWRILFFLRRQKEVYLSSNNGENWVNFSCFQWFLKRNKKGRQIIVKYEM